MNDLLFSVFPNENFVDIGLYQYGWEHCAPAHSFGPAARNHYIFHYVISGTGTLMADNSAGETITYQVKAARVSCFFPVRSTPTLQIPTFHGVHLVEFDGLRAKEIVETAGLSPDHPVYHSHSADLRQKMMEEMLYISHNSQESPFHLIGHTWLFLDYFMRSTETVRMKQDGSIRDFYIKEALSFIE